MHTPPAQVPNGLKLNKEMWRMCVTVSRKNIRMNNNLQHLKVFIVISILLFSNTELKSQDFPFTTEPGKCYAMCMIPAQYEEVEETFAVFIGDSKIHVELDSVYFDVDANSGKLIYLGNIKDLSIFQRDNIDKLEKIVFVVNTDNVRSFAKETIAYLKLTREAGFTEWREVLCQSQINKRIIKRIQEGLIDAGYLDYSEPVTALTEKTKNALVKYQSDLGLPVGQLDVETLKSLDIKI